MFLTKYDRISPMKTRIITKVSPDKIGHLNCNGVRIESNERATYQQLLLFGFDIELIQPSRITKVKNPDALIFGTLWEIKTPTGSNVNTIRNRFRKASWQASHLIFDLRFIKTKSEKIEKLLVELFIVTGRVRRMIIIKDETILLDYYK